MNKEHPFARWLILRTGTHKTGIRWLGGDKIPALGATLPICNKCNSDFGAQLEKPMSRILDDIEAGRGISDFEAEIIIRWLWKIEGLLWHVSNPAWAYSRVYKLRERVLSPLDKIRGRLVLAVALCETIEADYGDARMGLDSHTEASAIFVSGVFSRTGMMVVLDSFAHLIPKQFSAFRLAPSRGEPMSTAKLFHPKTTFLTDTHLVGITIASSLRLAAAHDEYAIAVEREHNRVNSSRSE